MLLLLAALPALFWDAGPGTAPQLREAGITEILVPAAEVESWKSVREVAVKAGDPSHAVSANPPSVDYRMNQASATRDPWIYANGWMFLRQPEATFYYDVPGPQSALAAAEAFCYGVKAIVRTDGAGLKAFARMLGLLRSAGGEESPTVADIGFLDDDSPAAGEVLNVLVRNNLLVKPIHAADRGWKLLVRFGSKEFPLGAADDPTVMMHDIRNKLTDEKRSIRIYGSAVVISRLTGTNGHRRVHLLNYAAPNRRVSVRVRVLGQYPQHRLTLADIPSAELIDFSTNAGATEFTLREFETYAVIDLTP